MPSLRITVLLAASLTFSIACGDGAPSTGDAPTGLESSAVNPATSFVPIWAIGLIKYSADESKLKLCTGTRYKHAKLGCVMLTAGHCVDWQSPADRIFTPAEGKIEIVLQDKSIKKITSDAAKGGKVVRTCPKGDFAVIKIPDCPDCGAQDEGWLKLGGNAQKKPDGVINDESPKQFAVGIKNGDKGYTSGADFRTNFATYRTPYDMYVTSHASPYLLRTFKTEGALPDGYVDPLVPGDSGGGLVSYLPKFDEIRLVGVTSKINRATFNKGKSDEYTTTTLEWTDLSSTAPCRTWLDELE